MIHGGNVWEGNDPAKWLDFSANLRPEGPPEWVADVLRSSLRDVRYYPDPDMSRAVKGIAAYAGVPEENVLPTSGGEMAIDLTLSRLSGRVYTRRLTFREYARRAQVHGRGHSVWSGAFCPGDTLILANPNNPTGETAKKSELLALRGLAEQAGAELIVDEAFIDFCPEYSVRGDVGAGLTVVGSLTKVLGIPGVRLGYVCAAPVIVRELRQKMPPWSLSAQASAVASALPEHLCLIREDAARNARRRQEFAAMLEGLGARVSRSGSNFLLAEFSRDMGQAAAALRGRGILVRDCASFGLPGSFLRLAVKTEAENRRLIAELEEILHAG